MELSRWSWKNVLDMKEAKGQVLYALPMAVTNVCYYSTLVVSVMLANHLGNLRFAASTLANSWASVTGFSAMLVWSMNIFSVLLQVCIRVSNELGAGNHVRAKHAMFVALKLSLLLALIVVLALSFGHNLWASFFTDSSAIMKEFAFMTPFLAVSIFFDSVQCVLSGAVYVNLGTNYFVGMPISCILVFLVKLYAKGLWIGLICGLVCQATTLFLVTHCRNGSRVDLSVDAVLVNPVEV